MYNELPSCHLMCCHLLYLLLKTNYFQTLVAWNNYFFKCPQILWIRASDRALQGQAGSQSHPRHLCFGCLMLAGGWMSQFLSLWVSARGLSTEGSLGFLTVGWLASHSECPKEKEQGGSCVLLLSIFCHVLIPGLCLAYNRCPRNIFEMREKKTKYIL